jgi:hypothetical protein
MAAVGDLIKAHLFCTRILFMKSMVFFAPHPYHCQLPAVMASSISSPFLELCNFQLRPVYCCERRKKRWDSCRPETNFILHIPNNIYSSLIISIIEMHKTAQICTATAIQKILNFKI